MDKSELIDILANAVQLGKSHLPDSENYEYCWDECTDEEQNAVKVVRAKLNKALEIYKKFKGVDE